MPSYDDEALLQGDENRSVVDAQLYANRPDQYTPWGYTKWTTEDIGDGNVKWSQTQGLSPEQQDIYNKQVAIQGGRTDLAGGLTGRMQDEFGQEMDWSGLQPGGGVATTQMTLPEQMQRSLTDDPTALRSRAEDAYYNKAMDRMGPQQEQAMQAREIKLRNQGLKPGDAAYDDQMAALETSQGDQRNQLQYDTVQAGLGEQSQLWNQQMGAGQFFNQAGQTAFNQNLAANQQNFGQATTQSDQANMIRQQQMTEQMQQRGFSLNEINALLSGQQVNTPQMPNFSQGAAAAPAPIYQGAVDAGNADAMGQQGLMSGVGAVAGALGSAAIMASDRRLKRNIKRIGTVKGHPWYSYDYIWGESSQGVMSDEVPSEFVIDFGGYDAVDYGRLLGE